jgi:hypothetical protein
VLLVANDLRVESLLVEVPDAVVSLVEPLRVDAAEAVHAKRDVLERRFDDQVKVVVEEAIGVEPPPEAGRCAGEELQPAPPIRVVNDDRHPRDAANREVVSADGRKHATWQTSHERDRRAESRAPSPVRQLFYRHVTGDSPQDTLCLVLAGLAPAHALGSRP